MSHTPTAKPFEAIRAEQFVVLTTYRRNGDAMPTTVWFAEQDGNIYITTNNRAGKVKRIQNNPQVTIAASDRVGNIHGPAIAARARMLPAEEAAIATSALQAKYGETYVQMTSQMDTGEHGSRVFMELIPA